MRDGFMDKTERMLTVGEIALARKIYHDAIDYQKVRIHKGRFMFFQPNDSGMTPNGEIYMSGNAYYADYSVLRPQAKAFFIHEMAHVWQYQLNILNPVLAAVGESFSHAFNYDKAYEYTLDANKDLLDYKIEQQASIIEDYMRVFVYNIKPNIGGLQGSLQEAIRGQLYQRVLKLFLANPGYARQVKKCLVKRPGPKRVMRCAKVRAE